MWIINCVFVVCIIMLSYYLHFIIVTKSNSHCITPVYNVNMEFSEDDVYFEEFERNGYQKTFAQLTHIAQNKGHIEGNLGEKKYFKKRMSFVYWIKYCNPKSFMEIGFNAGHSAAIVLSTAKNLEKSLYFDIGNHKYILSNFEWLKKQYSNIQMNIIIGNSTSTVPKNFKKYGYHKYDLIHIDGGHDENIAYQDIQNCKIYAHKNSIIILDDCYYYDKMTKLDFDELEPWEKGPLKALKKCLKSGYIEILFYGNKNIRHIVFKYIF